MKTTFRVFLLNICLVPALSVGAFAATSCSRANLTRCLDSACAINIGANPAARCQLCGTATAGGGDNAGLKSLTVGGSSTNTLTAKQLQSAPSDPGKRYAWAANECIKKIGGGCTADDVSNVYDTLIEQSCRAAGITADRTALFAASKKTKTTSTCESEIRVCMTDSKRCTGDLTACAENTDFDKFFAGCAVNATGCDDYVASIRTKIINTRDSNVKNKEANIQNIAVAYQSRRNNALASAQAGCKNNDARDKCIAAVCESNMKNKCDPTTVFGGAEKSMATSLCSFYDTACARLVR